MYLCVKSIDFTSFYHVYGILEMFKQWYFSAGFQNCSDNVVFFFIILLHFRTVPTLWYFLFHYQILELFRQCGIFLLDFRTVRSVWDFFYIFLLHFRTDPTVWCFLFYFSAGFQNWTVWYFLFYFSAGFQNCSDSVVFFCWILELFQQCGIFCFIFLLDFRTGQCGIFFSFILLFIHIFFRYL